MSISSEVPDKTYYSLQQTKDRAMLLIWRMSIIPLSKSVIKNDNMQYTQRHEKNVACPYQATRTNSIVISPYNKRHGKVLFRPPTPLKLQVLER